MGRSRDTGRTATFFEPGEIVSGIAICGCLLLVIVGSAFFVPGWKSMLVNCAAVFVGLKHCVWSASRRATRLATAADRAAFCLLWPGMDAGAFLDELPEREMKAMRLDWASAILKTTVAVAGLWMVLPLLASFSDALVGIAGMLGAILLIHCGLFHCLALAWRSNGKRVRPIMNSPLFANSLADFWSRRWNLAFRDAAALIVFYPTARRWGTGAAAFATFLTSGLVHDAAISLPARGGYGLPTAYFLLQYLGLMVEHRVLRGGGRWKPLASRAMAAVFVVVPLPLLFHPPFAENVIVPLLRALNLLAFMGAI